MKTAGYSKRTLQEKLGIKPGSRIAIINSPPDYWQTLGELPKEVTRVKRLSSSLDLIHFFTTCKSDLESRLDSLKEALKQNGALWVSWPKKAAKIETDLTEDVIRDLALRNQLVDIKVCAVDEVWSGLKLVYRLKDRK